MEREKIPVLYIFVGENRSKTAKEKGWSWQECQTTGIPKNSAKKLWEALNKLNINPDYQIFHNLWNDDGELNRNVVEVLKEMAEDGEVIIGMGKKVQGELKNLNIPHREMVHPAARGKWYNRDLYSQHVKKVLSES